MKIAGFQKNSFVDYKGKISAVIFTPGCNLDCYFCHNRRILGDVPELIDPGYVLEFLNNRKKFLDGVVITGGEPTLQPDLRDFILKVKAIDYPVKLDTNGTNPDILKALMKDNLLDYVAMDIKAPLSRYSEICGVSVDISDIEKSIDLLMQGSVDYELRTTVLPDLSADDIKSIAVRISGAAVYILQQYRRPECAGDIIDYRLLKQPHSSAFIKDLSLMVADYVQKHETRGVI